MVQGIVFVGIYRSLVPGTPFSVLLFISIILFYGWMILFYSILIESILFFPFSAADISAVLLPGNRFGISA